jgi:uncharacterized protein
MVSRQARWSLRSLGRWFLLLLCLAGIGYGCSLLWVESLWFEQLGFAAVFWQRFQTRFGLGLAAFGVGTTLFGGNLWLASQFRHPLKVSLNLHVTAEPLALAVPGRPSRSSPARPTPLTPLSGGLGLRWLLPVVVVVTLLVLLLTVHTLQLAAPVFPGHPQATLTASQFLPQFTPRAIGNLVGSSLRQPLWVLLGVGLGFGVWRYPRLNLGALGLVLNVALAVLVSGHWLTVLQFLQAEPFGTVDPLFRQDIGFYLFKLPFAELVYFWVNTILLSSSLAVVLVYLLSGDSLSQGQFLGWSRRQAQHVLVLAGSLCLSFSFGHWLARYKLLYHQHANFFGANYVDIQVHLPVQTGLIILAWVLALVCLGLAAYPQRQIQIKSRSRGRQAPWQTWLLFGMGSYGLLALLLGSILGGVVQFLVVWPNELQRETLPIQRSITATRQASNLDHIDVQAFTPTSQLTAADLQANPLTVANIRLWDSRPLLETNRQLQQLRPYYRFPSAFIDRYTFQAPGTAGQRQVFMAARELDATALPPTAQTWVNRHLVYTHGYGFTMSPVNTVARGGLPEYFVRDIGNGERQGQLLAQNPTIAATVPLTNPRLYFGQITRNYIFAPSRTAELDYPSNVDNVYNHYDAQGGVTLNHPWRRFLIALYLRDWELLFSNSLTPDTQALWRRQIQERVEVLAPFLRFDQQPYLVAVNPNQAANPAAHTLFWVMDAYTASPYYPYADPAGSAYNYIRNSVKVVVDTYDGQVSFYAADPNDPLLKTYQRIFPNLFQPLAAMPSALQQHLRYPIDLFRVQSQRLLRYHVTDPALFYNQEDQWQIPIEIYGNRPQVVEPYYLIMKLPTEKSEEFVLLYPFTPLRRPNLTAWLAARSDGKHAGKLLLYKFPKQTLIFGPEQLEARINQEPAISAQISLWNRTGSSVIQGNMLVIPIQNSLLYVEPLYLKAEQNSLPTLARVTVLNNDQIVMAETLKQALASAFPTAKPTAKPTAQPTQ